MRIMRAEMGLILFLGTLPLTTRASTQVLFNREGNQATVLLIGMPGDSDPVGLYQAMKVAPEDFQGKWAKRISLPASDGAKGWDVACLFSKVIENNGTCTMVFRHSSGRISVDRAAGRARLLLTGEEAARFAENFHLPAEINVIYRSRDGKLQASVVKEEGRVAWFVMDWNGKGIL